MFPLPLNKAHTMSRQAAESYITYLLEGDADAVLSLFSAEPSIEDPIGGNVHGRDPLIGFVKDRQQWFAGHGASLEHLRTTTVPERTVVEYTLSLDLDEPQYPLPYAVVGQHGTGGTLGQIRVYHSMWPLLGHHEIRSAILPARHDLTLSGVIITYQKALAEGDVETIVSTFEPDGYFREPAGGPHFYRGIESVAEFMAMILGTGGIALEHCTVTDDGVACAIEFNAVRFGPDPLVPQAGVAVYERGPSGALHAARIYDDVNVEALAGRRDRT